MQFTIELFITDPVISGEGCDRRNSGEHSFWITVILERSLITGTMKGRHYMRRRAGSTRISLGLAQ